MRVSARGTYGLRAVLDLSVRYGQGFAQTAEIAERQEIPESYLVQLLNVLRRGGLVRSVRGPKGGHALLRRPEEVTVQEVLAILEGPLDLLGEGGDRSEKMGNTVFREVWEEVERVIEEAMASFTFGDLCRRYRERHEKILFRT